MSIEGQSKEMAGRNTERRMPAAELSKKICFLFTFAA